MSLQQLTSLEQKLSPPAGLASINVINFEDWLQLSVFTDHAIYHSATNETQLRILAKMQPNDPIPDDVKATVRVYQQIKDACTLWVNNIAPGTTEIAQEVIRHKDDCAVYYDMVNAAILDFMPSVPLAEAKRLLTLEWQSATPSVAAEATRTRITDIIDRLLGEAKTRETKANDQRDLMVRFRDTLMTCNATLTTQTIAYEDNYGKESKTIKDLKGRKDKLDKDLADMRAQEDKFVIVLETAPLYLLIPFYGWLVMPGVLAGVGGALGVLRNKINDFVADAVKVSAELTRDEAYLQYHLWATGSTKEATKQIDKTIGSLDKIATAWKIITSDLTSLLGVLSERVKKDALTGNWDFFSADISVAKARWEKLAQEAQGYLENQLNIVTATSDINTAMKGVITDINKTPKAPTPA